MRNVTATRPTLPAFVVVLGTLGIMERDGVAITAAYGILAATVAYFATFAGLMLELLERATAWIVG